MHEGISETCILLFLHLWMFLVQSCGLMFGCLMFACFIPLSVVHISQQEPDGWPCSPLLQGLYAPRGQPSISASPNLCYAWSWDNAHDNCRHDLSIERPELEVRMWCRLVLGCVCVDWSGFDSFYLCYVAMRKWTLITGQSLPVTNSSWGTTLFWDFIHTKSVIW